MVQQARSFVSQKEFAVVTATVVLPFRKHYLWMGSVVQPWKLNKIFRVSDTYFKTTTRLRKVVSLVGCTNEQRAVLKTCVKALKLCCLLKAGFCILSRTRKTLPHNAQTTTSSRHNTLSCPPVPFYLWWKALAKCTKYLNGMCLECEPITTLQNSFKIHTRQNLHVGFDDKTSRQSTR